MLIPRILITGANGQLGNEFRALEEDFPGYEFIFLSRQELSVNDADAVREFMSLHTPQWLINCAAYTAVDKAETDKEQCMSINGHAAGVLAAVSKEFNTRLIHISTDYVFDGRSGVPYTEDAATGPISVYGQSKLLGEQLVQQNNAEAIIIRTSWVYSVFGHNFVKTMMRLMNERESINVVNDQHGSPTYAADLAKAVMHIIRSTKNAPGIYNYSNEGSTTWYEFACAIKELIGSTCKVNAIPTSQYPTAAKRPQYSFLDKAKIRSTFDLDIPHWKESLDLCVSRMLTSQT